MAAYNLRAPTLGALTEDRPYIEILTIPPPVGWGTNGKTWEFRIGGKSDLSGDKSILRRELYLGNQRLTQFITYRTGNAGNYCFDDVHLMPFWMDNTAGVFSRAASSIDRVEGQEGTPLSTTVGCGMVIQNNAAPIIEPGANLRYIVSYDGGSPLQTVYLGYFILNEL